MKSCHSFSFVRNVRGTVPRFSTTLLVVAIGAVSTALLVPATAQAQELEPTVICVEEVWELVVTSTDAGSSSPQISTVMAGCASLEECHFTFNINHASYPDWVPGGLQVLASTHDDAFLHSRGTNDATLHHDNETITWTQRLLIHNGTLFYEIDQGSSESWNHFGGQGFLRLQTDAIHDDLDEYSHEFDAESSGVGYAGNRVQSLVLKQVKKYSSDGLISDTAVNLRVH